MTQRSSALRATLGSCDSPRVHRTGSSSARGSRSTSTRGRRAGLISYLVWLAQT